jgi:hypothetical protein
MVWPQFMCQKNTIGTSVLLKIVTVAEYQSDMDDQPSKPTACRIGNSSGNPPVTPIWDERRLAAKAFFVQIFPAPV